MEEKEHKYLPDIFPVERHEFPEMNKFWEDYKKTIYVAVRNVIHTKDHDKIMDYVVSFFCFKYEACIRNYHVDYGKPFSAYVVGLMQNYIRKELSNLSKGPKLVKSVNDVPDTEYCIERKVINEEALAVLDVWEKWVVENLLEGWNLKELCPYCGYSYGTLRLIKTSAFEKLAKHLT